MNYWFRLYTSILDDPKVQRLPAEHFRGWINLLCLAKEGDGLLPSVEDIAFRLRMNEAQAQSLTEELVSRGLLESDGKNITPHNWHNRQFQSDVSTERVKRFRNVSETLAETAPEQRQSRDRTRVRAEQSRGGSGENPSPASRGFPRSARAPVLPDDEFLDGLQKNPAYSMLNVRHCYQRMLTWCQVNGRTPSRRRFINWLNKEDKPMTAKASPPKKAEPGAPMTYTLEDAARLEQTFSMDEWITGCIERNDRAHLEMERKIIEESGKPKEQWEPWVHRMYEYLNAATDAA